MQPISTAKQIFTTPYLCQVPELHCYGRGYLAEVGIPTSGDRDTDMGMLNNRRDMYMTIAAMVVHHEDGTPVTIKNPKDAPEIYQLLMTHLENWKYLINTVYNITPPPAEDFMMMDAFAKAIYPLVTYVTEGKPPEGRLTTSLATIQGKHGAFMRRALQPKPTNDGVVADADANIHRPIADDIARRLWRS